MPKKKTLSNPKKGELSEKAAVTRAHTTLSVVAASSTVAAAERKSWSIERG
jgi:hypothetical protein